MNTTNENRLGIDIGRVIMAPVLGGKADTSFLQGGLEQALRTPPSPGAFAAIATLVQACRRQAWLVSKAGPNVQRKTWLWLEHHDFYRHTGIKPGHVYFCLRREDKAAHCAALGITHFVDDRLDVLEHLRGVVGHRYLFGEQPADIAVPQGVVAVIDWARAMERVMADFG